MLPPIDEPFLLEFLTGLLNIPSPTGFSHLGIEFVREALCAYPELELHLNRKGALVAIWPGQHSPVTRALTAHVDTLGAMVKEIKTNGRLRLTNIGGLQWGAVETEGCTIFTRSGKKVRGSLLIEKASVHVHGMETSEQKRDGANMEVRLDAVTRSEQETRALGIEVGDFVAFDPRVEVHNGFIRSRFLDDKACVACVVAAVQAMHAAGLQPRQSACLHFSNYEEVGHGAAAGIPDSISELVTVDMAAVGEGQSSDEFHATICMKDSGGPYHFELSQRLRTLADEHHIPHKTDIYPFYGSDGEAYWRAGADVAVALIGPGVDASHNYERTHTQALTATTRWIMAYLLS